MNQNIEPGDLVRVVKSHCPAAWDEEGGTYFVALSAPRMLRGYEGIDCSRCGGAYPRGLKYVSEIIEPTREKMHPAAWLRKVPPLTEGEIAEDCAADLDHLTSKEPQDA